MKKKKRKRKRKHKNRYNTSFKKREREKRGESWWCCVALATTNLRICASRRRGEMAYHHQYHDQIERRNDDSSTSSSLNLLILRDRGCLFSQDVYALLPNVEGQMRAASIQSSNSRAEEFDDRTFKCVVPLRDGGTSICALIHKKFKPMETQEEEVQSVCKYISDCSLEYEIGTEEFMKRYPNKKARNVGRFDPRVDAILLLVKSNRDLDSFLHLMQRAEQPVPSIIVGALSTQAKTELKRRTISDVEKYKDVFMLVDASSSANIESTFIKRFFSHREIMRAKNFPNRRVEQAKQRQQQQRLRKSAERQSSFLARIFFGATDRNSSRTISSGRPTGLMAAAPQKAKKNAVAGGPTTTTTKRLMRRESIQSLAMAFVLVLGLGFIIIETRLPDANSIASSSPRRAASSSKSSSLLEVAHKTYPGFGLVDVSKESELSLEVHEIFPETTSVVLDSNAFPPSGDHSDDNRHSLARFVVSDALAPRNEKKSEHCAPIIRTTPTNGGAIYQTLDGKTPSGPPLISAGALIAHPDRIFIYAPPRASKKQRHISSVESMTLELPCAREASSRIMKFIVRGRSAKKSKRDSPFFETRIQAITSGASVRTIRNVRFSSKSENALETKCKNSRCTITVGALRGGTISFSASSIERASNSYGSVVTFASDGSAKATTGSLEALKELLSNLEYAKAPNTRKSEDVVSITLTYDEDGKTPTAARAEQARVLVHVRAACTARTAKVSGNGVAKTGNNPGKLATIDVFCKDGLGQELKGAALRGGGGSQELTLEVTHGSDVTQRMKFGVAPDASCYRAQFVRPASDYEVTVIIDGAKTPNSPRYVAIDETKTSDVIEKASEKEKKKITASNQRPIIPARYSEDVQEALRHIASKEHGGSKWKAANRARNWRPTQVDVIEENEDDNREEEKNKRDYEEDDAREEKRASGLKSFLERRNVIKAESERTKMTDTIKKAKIPEGESKFMKLEGRAPIASDMVVIETEEPTDFHSLPRIPEWNEETIPRPENPVQEDDDGGFQHGDGEYVHLHEYVSHEDGSASNGELSSSSLRMKQAFKASLKLDSSDGVFKFDRLQIEQVRRRESGHKHLDGHS